MSADRVAKRLYSREDASRYLDKSLSEIDRLIRSGRLLARKDGRRTIIDIKELDRFADQLPSVEPKG